MHPYRTWHNKVNLLRPPYLLDQPRSRGFCWILLCRSPLAIYSQTMTKAYSLTNAPWIVTTFGLPLSRREAVSSRYLSRCIASVLWRTMTDTSCPESLAPYILVQASAGVLLWVAEQTLSTVKGFSMQTLKSQYQMLFQVLWVQGKPDSTDQSHQVLYQAYLV